MLCVVWTCPPNSCVGNLICNATVLGGVPFGKVFGSWRHEQANAVIKGLNKGVGPFCPSTCHVRIQHSKYHLRSLRIPHQMLKLWSFFDCLGSRTVGKFVLYTLVCDIVTAVQKTKIPQYLYGNSYFKIVNLLASFIKDKSVCLIRNEKGWVSWSPT